MFKFLKSCRTVFNSDYTILCGYHDCTTFATSLHPHQHLQFSVKKIIPIPVSVKFFFEFICCHPCPLWIWLKLGVSQWISKSPATWVLGCTSCKKCDVLGHWRLGLSPGRIISWKTLSMWLDLFNLQFLHP